MLLRRGHPAHSRLSGALGALGALVVILGAASAFAERASTQESLERMKEGLRLALSDGTLPAARPVMLVAATPAFEETRAWFPTAAAAAVVEVFGADTVRICEACMNPRTSVMPGRLEHTSALGLPEIVALDAAHRGSGIPARAAVWVDETPRGVAVRLVSLENSQLLFARNFEPRLREQQRTARTFTVTEDLERRMRGDSLTHVILDAAGWPNPIVALEVLDQFGARGEHLAGLSLSLLEPTAGAGLAFHHVFPEAFNASIGGRLMLSLPTLLVTSISGESADLLDPLVTGVLTARIPVLDSNYAIVLSASTQGRVGVGISLLNFSFLPVLP